MPEEFIELASDLTVALYVLTLNESHIWKDVFYKEQRLDAIS